MTYIVLKVFCLSPADKDSDDITINGTIRLCEDLGVDPEDVVLLAVAFELKSPAMGIWERKEWVEGWKSIGLVLIQTCTRKLLTLRILLADVTLFQP